MKAENEELKIRLEEKDAELGERDRRIEVLEGVIERGKERAASGNGNGGAQNGIGGLSDLVNASNFLAVRFPFFHSSTDLPDLCFLKSFQSANDNSSTSSSISSMQF